MEFIDVNFSFIRIIGGSGDFDMKGVGVISCSQRK